MQGLLRELLGALPAGDARRAQVLEAYGEALAARNLTEDAALAFLAAGCLEQALARYKVAGQWCMAFVLAGKPSLHQRPLFILKCTVCSAERSASDVRSKEGWVERLQRGIICN